MYNAGPRATAAWRVLFEHVFADAGVNVRFIEHGFPQPIDTLWREPQLCGAFMCGWPFVRADRAMQPIAAPVPMPPRYAGLPRYCSEFLVREESGWTSIEQTFGHRIGWMALDSQSGFNAPRALLATHVSSARRALYGESRGPYVTPAKTLAALDGHEVDVIALDGFYLDLVRHYDPQMLAGTRTVATTSWTPIPLVIAAPGVDAHAVARLRARLVTIHGVAAYRPLLDDVLLVRFVKPDTRSYAALEAMADFAVERGYDAIR
jgi:ABC-type phosphate/phosphonate transport system substrate-binding protein